MKRCITVNLYEIPVFEQLSYTVPITPERGYEGRNHNQAGIRHELAHLANATNVFATILGTETEITTETMPDIVTIQNIGATALGHQPLLNPMSQR